MKRDRNRLRVRRAELRLTQLDTAARARMSVSKYWRIENGYDEPEQIERAGLAKALRTTEAELFPESEQVSA